MTRPQPHSADVARPPAGAGDADTAPARISVGSGDDAVTRIQLAARWAEAYAPPTGDSLRGALRRFRIAFEYLDAVTHGVEPHEPPDEGDAPR